LEEEGKKKKKKKKQRKRRRINDNGVAVRSITLLKSGGEGKEEESLLL
jgi:hypothetical protein